MARRPLALVGVLVVLALAAVACGGDDEGTLPSVTTVAEDQSLAESLVLTLGDLPAGWKAEPAEDEQPGPLDTCDPGDSPGRTGLAETADFALGSDSVANAVAVFVSSEAASASLDRVRPQADCMVAEIRAGAVDNEQFTAVDASVQPLDIPATGGRSEAHRVSVTLRQSPSNLEIDVTIDLVFVAKGRAGFSLVAQGVLTPFDRGLLEDLTGLMETRLP